MDVTADSSWGRTTALGTRATGDRESQRAEDRARRAAERVAAAQARSEDGTIARDAAMRQREAAREKRREEEAAKRATADAGDPAFTKRRASGSKARTGYTEKPRDTRHYQTIVDIGRIRELAKRGASVGGLAAAFGISEAEVEAALE